MKKIAVGFVSVFLLLFHGISYAEAISEFEIDESTVALWRMNSVGNASGAIKIDDEVGGYHLKQTLDGTSLTLVNSVRGLGKAITGFSNNTGALELINPASNTIPDAVPQTFEAWIKWNSEDELPQNNLSAKQTIIAKLVSSTTSVWLYLNNGEIKLSIRSGDGDEEERIYSSLVSPKVGLWYHVAYTIETGDFDGEADVADTRVYLYFNDENNADVTPDALTDIMSDRKGVVYDDFLYRSNGWRFRLGKRYSISNDAFEGVLDEVRISNIAKNTFEVFQAADEHKYRGKNSFIVMQSLLFENTRPSNEIMLNNFGLPYLPAYGHGLNKYWDIINGENPYYDFPNENIVKAWAKDQSAGIGYLDIEHLPVSFRKEWDHDGNKDTPLIVFEDNEFDRSIRELASIADWVHQANPNLKIGYYGIIPQREFWSFVVSSTHADDLESLQSRNKLFQSLARHVDVLFPSLYTFYNETEDWKVYAKGMYDESRQYNKPTYAFLWPQFHNSRTLSWQFMDGALWRMQLEEVYRLGFDGIIIWGGWQANADFTGNLNWADHASDTDPGNWWYQTLDFLYSKNMLPENSTWSPLKSELNGTVITESN